MNNSKCKCRNCRHVEKQRQTALRGLVTPGSGSAIAEAWNATLEAFPCQRGEAAAAMLEFIEAGPLRQVEMKEQVLGIAEMFEFDPSKQSACEIYNTLVSPKWAKEEEDAI